MQIDISRRIIIGKIFTNHCSLQFELRMLSWLSGALLVLPIVKDDCLWACFEIRMYMQAAMAH